MASTFSHTIRALAIDASRQKPRLLLVASVILVGWFCWLFGGRVGVYEVTHSACLESGSVARPVASVVSGRVTKTRLSLGSHVKAGEMLVELDSRSQLLGLAQGAAHLKDLQNQIKAIDREIEAERTAAAARADAGQAAIEENSARILEAHARANYAEQRLEYMKSLVTANAVSRQEVLGAESESQACRAAVRASEAAAERLTEEFEADLHDRQARIRKLQRERSELTGEKTTQDAALQRLQRDVDLCRIEAPTSGRLGQVRDFPVGAYVKSGEELAYVIPADRPRVVAYFPVAAAGRIRAGQMGRLRLKGFPWTEYGKISLTVVDVGSEPQGDTIRVELNLDADPGVAVPLEHGLTGSAEVMVERVSPAFLVLRAMGWFLEPHHRFGDKGDRLRTP